MSIQRLTEFSLGNKRTVREFGWHRKHVDPTPFGINLDWEWTKVPPMSLQRDDGQAVNKGRPADIQATVETGG